MGQDRHPRRAAVLSIRSPNDRCHGGVSQTVLHHKCTICYHPTVIRTQISLTEEQMRRLRREARRRHVSLAAIVRDAVDQVVPDEDDSRSDRIDDLLQVAGSAASGTGDVAREHDEVLAGGRW